MEYRRSLAASFLFRFFVDVALRLEAEEPSFTLPLPPSFASAAARFARPPAAGLQYYARAGQDAVVGAPHRHLAADIQARSRMPNKGQFMVQKLLRLRGCCLGVPHCLPGR